MPAAPGSWPAARAAISCSAPARPTRSYKNFVTNFARGLAADPAAPALSMRRARSTFICGHLAAGTPVGVLLEVTGIAEAGSLARYARHVAGVSSSKGVLRARCRAERTPMSGSGLALPPPAAASATSTVAFAAELIDRSGKAPVIEAALAHATGRPRPLPARAVLAALLCLALDDRPLFLTEATRLLFQQLSGTSRRLLGVPGTASGERAFLAAYRRVRYCFGAICSVMDPSPLPKNRRLSEQDLTARTRPMTPAQAQAARGRLEAFINSLIEASISVLTGEERAAFDGCTGLDATPVPLFSRGPSRRTGLCASDPDGGWYVREGDHRDREDDKGKPLRKIAWALEATIATTARPPGAPPGCPNLAAGLALTRPGEDPGGTGARVLASVAARGHKPGWLGYDRAYTQALPGRFHLPARALGYKPVMDYRADQLGIQANTGGAILVEGTWYCPALPGPLITATTRLRDHAITRDLYDQQITARRPYQLHRKDGPDTDGYQRLTCPALGRTPRSCARSAQARCHPATGAPRHSSHRPNRRGSAARPRSPSRRTPAPATARTCPTAARPGTRPTPPCATPSKASTASSKTPPTKPSPSPPGAASAASPPSRSSPPCCSWPPTSARSAPGAPSPPATRPASPAGHGGAGPACATTSPTADTHKQPPPPRYPQPGRSATPQASPQHPQQARRHSRPRRTATSASARARRHTKIRPPPEFCRYDTGSSVGNPSWS